MERFETLKKVLLEKGDEAIIDFIGFTPLNGNIEEQILLAYEQMTDEEIDTFYRKYVTEPSLEIEIKYFDKPDYKIPRLKKIEQGDWIDLYAAEDCFVPYLHGTMIKQATLIPLGVAMRLPKGYEAILAPRSSSFKNWGIIQTNSIGVIDNSYSGDKDQWLMSVICLSPRTEEMDGVYIKKGDKIAQFRIQKSMPEIILTEVEHLDDIGRGSFGSTGKR